MGVVKTASESVLEEVVVPSEEANYSVQGHAGKFLRTLFYLFVYCLVFCLFLFHFLLFSFLYVYVYVRVGEEQTRQAGWRQTGKKRTACPACEKLV